MIFFSVLISYLCDRCLSRSKYYSDNESDISEFTKRIIRKRLEIIKWKRKEAKRARKALSKWTQNTREHSPKPDSIHHAIKLEEVDSPNNSKTSLSFLPTLTNNKVSDVELCRSPEVGASVKSDLSRANGLASIREESVLSTKSANIRQSSNLNRNAAVKGTSSQLTVLGARSSQSGSSNPDVQQKLSIPSISITLDGDNTKRKTVTFKEEVETDSDVYKSDSENTSKAMVHKQSNLKKK